MKNSLKTLFIRIDGYGFFNLVFGTVRWFVVLLMRRIYSEKKLKRRIYNFEMYLDIFDDGLSKQLIKYKKRELDHKYILEKVLKPGFNVLDIGANIGYYTLIEKQLTGESGKIIAVEPSPANIELLKINAELNAFKNIKIFQAAISSHPGKKDFFLSYESNLNTFHNYGSVESHLTGETIEVDTYTVPGILREANCEKLDLIRMDVEGHEVDVIEGMLEQIADEALLPSIIFETHISRYNEENNMRNILKQLFSHGYQAKYVASSWQKGSSIIESKGYQPLLTIPTDGVRRAIYEDIGNEDAEDLICNTGGIRTVYLKHKSTKS